MIKTDKSIANTYDFYASKVKEPISKKDYLKINNMFNIFLFTLLVEGFRVALPERLGDMFISGRKIQRSFNKEGKIILPPDWGATKKLWDKSEKAKEQKKIVRHTDSVVYKLKWSKFNVPLVNKHFIQFRLSRTNKRAIAHRVKQGKEYIIDS